MAAGAVTAESASSTGSAWLLNKTIKPPSNPQASIGQEFYRCYSSGSDDEVVDIDVSVLRKGRKTSCAGPDLILAVTKYNFDKNGAVKSEKYLEVMDVNVPTGYRLIVSGCTNETIAIAKWEDGEQLTKHLKAWDFKDNKFVALSNLKNISCSKMFISGM